MEQWAKFPTWRIYTESPPPCACGLALDGMSCIYRNSGRGFRKAVVSERN